jgi:hypothetical protein
MAMLASAVLDLPTGATVVCAFGLSLLILGVVARLQSRPMIGAPAVPGTGDSQERGRCGDPHRVQ